jgi:hypothetical protein
MLATHDHFTPKIRNRLKTTCMGLGLVRLLQDAGHTEEARTTLASLENGFQGVAGRKFPTTKNPRKIVTNTTAIRRPPLVVLSARLWSAGCPSDGASKSCICCLALATGLSALSRLGRPACTARLGQLPLPLVASAKPRVTTL